MLKRWLQEAEPGAVYCYHRGELARDKLYDPDLAAVADRLLQLSTGRFDGCPDVDTSGVRSSATARWSC